MFPYRDKYTESESDIKNYNLFYKTPKMPKYFLTFWKLFKKIEKFKKINVLFCIMYKLYNSLFVFVCKFCSFGTLVFFCIFIFIYILHV